MNSAVDFARGSPLSQGPTGYILSYGVSYRTASGEGKAALPAAPTCPPSAEAVRAAFVTKCGFSPQFSHTLDKDVTRSGMIEDVRRAATTIASHDVVVLFFSGHGTRLDDTSCVFDCAGCFVSVRKLQAVFAEVVMRRKVCDVALVVILDCCQTLSCGTS